ncbi:MAG TPA: hypothetical protein VLF89_10220 [Candidatus Saccharimonadales bacterium]|nr:hypothetical protein [Candidatus Saccharimonadales bacterium]
MNNLSTTPNNITPPEEVIIEGSVIEKVDLQTALSLELDEGKNKKYMRFTLAALSSMPWVGSFLGAASGLSAELDQDRVNNLLKLWLQEHEGKIKQLALTLQDIYSRLDNFGEDVEERIQSEEYLALVRGAFRTWDQSDTEEKRQMIKRLITNAGATTLCPDDLVRLFIKWIDEYHESHFAVIKQIYKNPGITRGAIWDQVRTERPRENSAEADLFRFLIRDLSTGGVIRQDKDVNSEGQFMRATQRSNKGSRSSVMESAFENSKPYVLTELGSQFISYVLNDTVTRVGG